MSGTCLPCKWKRWAWESCFIASLSRVFLGRNLHWFCRESEARDCKERRPGWTALGWKLEKKQGSPQSRDVNINQTKSPHVSPGLFSQVKSEWKVAAQQEFVRRIKGGEREIWSISRNGRNVTSHYCFFRADEIVFLVKYSPKIQSYCVYFWIIP